MLVKGAALSFTVYKNYPCYVMGDIDIILNNKRQDISDTEDKNDVKFFQSLNILEWERHQHHDVNMNGIIPIDFSEIWERGLEANFGGERVMIMSSEDMLLAACINSCRKRFFRLKSLCDIAEIIAYYQELNWMKFLELIHKYNCELIVYTALMTTLCTVDCEVPNLFLEKIAVATPKKLSIRQLIIYLVDRPIKLLFSSSNRIFTYAQKYQISLFAFLKILVLLIE